MSISDRSRVATVLVTGLVALGALWCGPPETCVRESDCAVGLTCALGTCVDPSTSSLEGGAGEASAAADAAAVVDSAAAAQDSAATATPEAGRPTPHRFRRSAPVDDAGAPPADPSGF